MNKQTTTRLHALGLAAALLTAAPVALAVDGQKLIDMAKVAAGGLTPGDTPGFPVTISQPGSYKLSGNLTVPNPGTTAIEIAASHVTLDLNGFAILGITDCSSGLSPCVNAGNGVGIVTRGGARFNITLRNGTIQGMGREGILLHGDSHLVEYMHVRSNGGDGISIRGGSDKGSSIVQHNTAQRNSGNGIVLGRGLVSHNVADVNGSGIVLVVGTVSHNVATQNVVNGLLFPTGNAVSYIGNTLTDNRFNVSLNGKNLGQNLCGTTVCPGAQF